MVKSFPDFFDLSLEDFSSKRGSIVMTACLVAGEKEDAREEDSELIFNYHPSNVFYYHLS